MAPGLFGKLAAKRDFVSVDAPQPFLDRFEPWIEACLADSQDTLAAEWQNAYCNMSIWRFWLGPEICGDAAMGALMPSLDGIGRNYPLTVVAMGHLAPPSDDPQSNWFTEIETFLLSTLENADYDAILDALAKLPSASERSATDDLLVPVAGGLLIHSSPEASNE